MPLFPDRQPLAPGPDSPDGRAGRVLVLPAKRVGWAELFFDLVYVYAVTRAAELVRADHTPLGLVAALVAFVPVYWVWVGNTMHANLHDVDDARDRLGMFAVGFCSLLLAVALPDAYGDAGLLFGAGYWAARLVLLALVAGREHRRAFTTFTVGACVTGPLLVAGGLLGGDARLAVWAVAALVDLSVPLLIRRRVADLPFEPSHVTERFGLLIIIALGETVVATAAAVERPDPAHLTALAAAFVVACGMWWTYFTFVPSAIESELASRTARIDVIRPVLSYGHLALVAGIIAVAAAIGRAVAEPEATLPRDTAALLFGGAALYLATFAYTRWQLFRTLATPRLLAAAGCLGLLALAPEVPASWSIAALAAVLIVLNAVEHRLVPRTLRRADPQEEETTS